MKNNKKKITVILFAILTIILILGISVVFNNSKKGKIVSVSSKKELMKIYKNEYGNYFSLPDGVEMFFEITVFPYYILYYSTGGYSRSYNEYTTSKSTSTTNSADVPIPTANNDSAAATDFRLPDVSIEKKTSNTHSNTNLQVENVDEADINKTDGKYIYSISNDKVLITDVSNPKEMNVVGKILGGDNEIPVDLILDSKNHSLAVIKEKSNKDRTFVTVYDISNVKNPRIEKSFELKNQYYTSRAVNGYIYIISTGNMKKTTVNNKEEIDISYIEDNNYKEIEFKNIQYLKGKDSTYQTVVASYKLGSKESIKVNSYLFRADNVYVSENSIYIANNAYGYLDYEDSIGVAFKHLFGFGGFWGWRHYEDVGISNTYFSSITQINKIDIKEKGTTEYVNSAEIEGKTINQFSMDEYNGEFRIALHENSKGSRIVVLNDKLKQIGATEYVEPTEKMYASRFMGNRAYLVTYRNMDPLFVFDLSNGEKPTLLGKLEIPGYSTYLQAYDDNHLIGIGMNSETTVRKDSMGRVISTSTSITGMKMAIFDVTDVKNPKQISETKIGDRKTTSAVLDNHKALLFSKEKGIICIPVNTYSSELEIQDSENITTVINNYKHYSSNKKALSEGYLVYDINLENGFKLKGNINHELSNYEYDSTQSNSSSSDLLRGLWIQDNLFTISQSEIKANRISDLTLLDGLNLYTYKHIDIEKAENKEKNSNTVSNDVNNSVNNTVVVANEIEG